ncbi:Uncharacterized protein dnm_042660 [Desulfonema magnum]|uniref:Uncharacterized protein n=1 Tax=Desulfonema magnum TaxID=45655 RepID=A0A975BNF8_9BACT|nr:Uncharacterized protein dnm_042660 [Desulfonema magnum]
MIYGYQEVPETHNPSWGEITNVTNDYNLTILSLITPHGEK